MTTLRVATFNLRHCRGLDGITSLERAAATIAELGADLIALQEIDVGMTRSGSVDQAAELAALTGMFLHFEPTIERDEGRYGIGLAASEDLDIEALALPTAAGLEPRAVLRTSYRGLVVLATHLSLQRRPRRAQIDFLARLAGSVEAPVVLAGDLNAGGWELRKFADAGLRGPSLATFPAARPRRRIDHVLAGSGAWVTSARTVASDASDHLPLVAEVEFVGPASR